MSRRNKIIIAVIILILLLLALAYFLLQPKISVVTGENAVDLINSTRTGGLVNTTTGSNVNRGTNQPAANVNAAPTPPPPPDERTNLRRLASAFAERFGSFSNQGNYDNILELKTFMTARMSAWADGYVAEQRKKPASPAFFGITTRAINTNVTVFDTAAGTATVKVTTQRSEQSGSGASKIYYQDISLDFIKEGDIWKVDAATWKPL